MKEFTRERRAPGAAVLWWLGRVALVLFAIVALLAAGLVVAGLVHRPARGIAPGFEGRLVRAAGLDLRVRQAGQGPDVLLVHGQGGSIEDWDAVMEPLSRRYRVTAYDRPGTGFSDPGHEVQDFEGNAFVLEALAGQLGLRSPVLVGHSYGGGVVLEVAARALLEIRGLVLVGSVGYGCGVVRCRSMGALDAVTGRLALVPGLGTGLAWAASRTVGPGLLSRYAEEAFSPEPGAAEYVQKNLIKINTPKATVSYYEQERAYEPGVAALAAAYRQIRRPTVILQGRLDFFTELLATAQRLNEELAGSELRWVERAGHMLPVTRPQEVVAAVDRLFELLPAGPAPEAIAVEEEAEDVAPAAATDAGAGSREIPVEEDEAP